MSLVTREMPVTSLVTRRAQRSRNSFGSRAQRASQPQIYHTPLDQPCTLEELPRNYDISTLLCDRCMPGDR